MNALSHEFDLSHAAGLHDAREPGARLAGPAALTIQWDAIHEAATAVGILAQLGEEETDEDIRSLPQRIASLDDTQRDLVARAIDDLAAVMQPGLRALLSLNSSGHDTTSAALTLWREFHSARGAILALAEQK